MSRAFGFTSSAFLFLFVGRLSVVLVSSVPALPPQAASVLLGSSFVGFAATSFFITIYAGSAEELSFPWSVAFTLGISTV